MSKMSINEKRRRLAKETWRWEAELFMKGQGVQRKKWPANKERGTAKRVS